MKLKIAFPAEIHAHVKLPASKSISNRMLIISELSGKKIQLSNLSDCDDTFVMRRALNNRTPVTDIMAAGTSMRFLSAFFAATPSETTLTGTERMKHRPINVLVDALRSLGADIAYTEREGFPPLHIRGQRLHGGNVSLPGNVSSQYISALLMVAPLLDDRLTLRLTGDVVSRPYINITLSLMRRFGITVSEPDDHTFIVEPSSYTAGTYTVENDWSASSYWYEMLALAKGGEVVLDGLFEDSLQGDSCVRELFAPLGIITSFADGRAILRKKQPAISHYERDLTTCPDLAQTMVATCCAMGITFRFGGLQSLRIKETDRLLALQNELAKLGYVVDEHDGNTLSWDGRRLPPLPQPAIDTYEDHRMAMCMAPCAIGRGGLIINNPQVVSKSYPAFWEDLRKAGASIEELP